jgi:Phosphoribosyl transferase domain.
MKPKRLTAKQIFEKRRDYLDIARQRDAYYERIGNSPLVGYAGKYNGPDGQKLQFVGFAYINVAKLEECPADDLDFIGTELADKARAKLGQLSKKTVLVAAPVGGYALSIDLGRKLKCRTIKAEKKVTKVGIEGQRDETKLVLDRHELSESDEVIIVEDVCNNFSTTLDLIRLVESFGAKVIAIVCYLNRSPDYDFVYNPSGTEYNIPIIPLVRQIIAEFKQDAPEVMEDIKKGTSNGNQRKRKAGPG